MSISSIWSPTTDRSPRPTLAARARSLGNEKAFWAAAAVLLGAGVLLRLILIELKPFHHDEGVNGFFLIRLSREGIYHYDPENYHGPTLYYAALVFVYLLGLNTMATRIVTALFGIVALWLVLGFRSVIGRTGALVALGLLALSPGAVFFSRYFIHEILLLCFTIGLMTAVLQYCETRRPALLLAIGAWAALVFATKETAILTAGVLLIAWPLALFYVRLHRRLLGGGRAEASSTQTTQMTGEPLDLVLWLVSGLALFVLISVVLYSSFFTYPEGVHGAVRTYSIWRKTGESAHTHAWDAYLSWMFRTEAPCLVLGAIGVIVALWRAESRRLVFLALWTIGMIAAYSIIKYKTPWLILNMVLPLSAMGGYAVSALLSGRAFVPWSVGCVAVATSECLGLLFTRGTLRGIAAHGQGWLRGIYDSVGEQVSRHAQDPRLLADVGVPLLVTAGVLVSVLLAAALRRRPWIAAAPALIAAASVSLLQTVELNFFHYDDDRYVYVYAQTKRGFLDLVERVQRLAEAAGTGNATPTSVTSAEHWPLSWYLRDYTHTGYHGAIGGLDTATIVIGHVSQDGELRSRLGEGFTRLGTYPLRPGVELVLFARTDVARKAGLIP